ncbi:rhomboid family intramembrane serine protease [Adhaeribacter rhizoryzae]|uniref:Rhomboid family intramembrane serine protease n=1 Tax=Adhaeribacter rhizoryzae TaxID=2607907 RepID=A0A5M6DJM6_9BACT|nr:rhomboid family intramembrane serine protease [Adhaeribacter rhizoryzae]KAA5546462.1 rhomboid family intramembrane serine protease [Adhaeribacter rhizoryzae]
MSVTLILIIITVGISMYAWSNEDLMRKWIFHPFYVNKNHQYYRFITSGFLHADWVHLFFNMLTLYFFGDIVETVFVYHYGPEIGILLYLFIYFGGMIVADIPSYIKHKKDYDYRALGASGAVSAIIFSSILFSPTREICLYAFICMPGFIFGLLYLIYSYYQGKRMGDNINHDAHFYGAVFGFILTIFLVPGSFGNFVQKIMHWGIF